MVTVFRKMPVPNNLVLSSIIIIIIYNLLYVQLFYIKTLSNLIQIPSFISESNLSFLHPNDVSPPLPLYLPIIISLNLILYDCHAKAVVLVWKIRHYHSKALRWQTTWCLPVDQRMSRSTTKRSHRLLRWYCEDVTGLKGKPEQLEIYNKAKYKNIKNYHNRDNNSGLSAKTQCIISAYRNKVHRHYILLPEYLLITYNPIIWTKAIVNFKEKLIYII